jgi:hypothetical protein
MAKYNFQLNDGRSAVRKFFLPRKPVKVKILSQVIGAATQCALATSQLVACAKVKLAHKYHHNNNHSSSSSISILSSLSLLSLYHGFCLFIHKKVPVMIIVFIAAILLMIIAIIFCFNIFSAGIFAVPVLEADHLRDDCGSFFHPQLPKTA